MPYEIVRNDITNMQVDAIVNTASVQPVVGYGVDTGIHQKAGPRLLAARQKIGKLRIGDSAITPGYDLPAKYVIHTVTPVWQGGDRGEEDLLKRCYERSLLLAKRHRCSSVAFPLMAAGNHGFPKDVALRIALDAISRFLLKHEMQVYLVVFSRDAFQLSEKLFQGVSSFIDENYILEKSLEQYGVTDKCSVRELQQQMTLRLQQRQRDSAWMEEAEARMAAPMAASAPAPSAKPEAERKTRPAAFAKPSLTDMLAQTDAGFSETLLQLIDRTGKKDSEIYNRANVSRQHFSKIRKNPGYKPTKTTALAFAVALELDLEQTRDLIGRAGYALTKSSKFDVIIMYFIQAGNYNMFDINATLFEFDQSLLGG